VLPGGAEDVVDHDLAAATTPGTLTAALHPARPSPFTRETTLVSDVPGHGGMTTLRVYNVGGRLVRTLVSAPIEAGRHEARWDGADEQGLPVSSGVYFFRFQVGEEANIGKVLLIR